MARARSGNGFGVYLQISNGTERYLSDIQRILFGKADSKQALHLGGCSLEDMLSAFEAFEATLAVENISNLCGWVGGGWAGWLAFEVMRIVADVSP